MFLSQILQKIELNLKMVTYNYANHLHLKDCNFEQNGGTSPTLLNVIKKIQKSESRPIFVNKIAFESYFYCLFR